MKYLIFYNMSPVKPPNAETDVKFKKICFVLHQFWESIEFICFMKFLSLDMDSSVCHSRKIETLCFLFLLLPPLNRLLLKKLMELLHLVAGDDKNKMDAYNLGVVFAPNIVCTRKVRINCE